MKCRSCGKTAKLTWCDVAKDHICRDCCLKGGGRTCDREKTCAFI